MLYWIASTISGSLKLPAAYLASVDELVADDLIPLDARPMVVTDRKGRAKWTVSIPPSLEFPLRPSDYANICQRADEISERLQGIKDHFTPIGGSFPYHHKDPNFIDVQEAEQDELLPAASEGAVDPRRRPVASEVQKDFGDGNQKFVQAASGKGICERSLTYVMETNDAGLGKTLMGLWMSYGLAKEEGRAFFIDDTNWYLQHPNSYSTRD